MQALSKLLSQISDPNEMESVLVAVLTENERDAIGNRLHIIESLIKGSTQREIASDLGVGIATVTRGAQAFKSGKFDVLQPYLKNMS